MTPETEKFFIDYGPESIKSLGNRMGDSPTIEELYQAFEERVMEELTSSPEEQAEEIPADDQSGGYEVVRDGMLHKLDTEELAKG